MEKLTTDYTNEMLSKIDATIKALELSGGMQIDGKARRVLEFTEGLSNAIDFLEKLKEIDKLYLAKCEEVNRLKAELGQSLKLPCNVGDTVYAHCSENCSAFGILEYYVDEINVGIETTVFLCSAYSEQCGEYQSECLDEIEPCTADFGKSVFLTREEAQAKLKEGR